ncbi:hypothetical protein AXG93_3128s1040 [Marchantia polymorpha subsp. ruderalis]|uniref:Uncharacterized protein n=1 Tax=Marchantia polymorpha subsp. ruderalis TaxID=1480154 RepID=A0A176WEC1_MARPO|nr:hypothetical protein AXG93_3128s1040 [Marchantia polymorpha subsp. ruderalis]
MPVDQIDGPNCARQVALGGSFHAKPLPSINHADTHPRGLAVDDNERSHAKRIANFAIPNFKLAPSLASTVLKWMKARRSLRGLSGADRSGRGWCSVGVPKSHWELDKAAAAAAATRATDDDDFDLYPVTERPGAFLAGGRTCPALN